MARVVAASLLDCPFSRASLGNGIRLLTVGRIGDSGQLLVDVLPDNEILKLPMITCLETGTRSDGAALLLHQDSSPSLEPCRNSLSEKDT